ncbi:hypothetical protein [Cupriavidus sp. USMAA2-4]|uniref:hypothetical protein n=1 Tax=Cupriavidus sp. USMAA2-4 TaxID=876364 RepID=UPI001E5FF2E4|nr:hypothetical protein [Cupriavidus sp. USMAA2-4]
MLDTEAGPGNGPAFLPILTTITMSKTMISAAEAAGLLPRGKKVHTFIRPFGWHGSDVDREAVLAAFEAAKEVEVSADAAIFHHHLAVQLEGIRTYVETHPASLRKLLPDIAASFRSSSVWRPKGQRRGAQPAGVHLMR